jgi:peptide-methionine (S)-S-oxide reductase
VQHDFDHVPGVLSTVVGYTGGHVTAPSYEQVSNGKTGHVEAIQISFDTKKISYQELLLVFLHGIDPKQSEGQFCDIGTQYRPVIFYHDDQQKQIAIELIQKLEKTMGLFAVAIEPATAFFPAEEYHQKFYHKQSSHYQRYSKGSGREKRLKDIWGKE